MLDPLGRTTTYGYDTANQLKSISYSDLKTPNVSFTYDSDGQRLTVADGTGTSTYSYDSLHRLTQSTNGASQQLQYGYDLKGHLTTLTYPGGTNTVTRTYDAVGRLSSVADWLTHTTSFGYDADSNLTTETYPNTTKATFTYDAADRLMGIVDTTGRKNTQFLNFGYSRDAANQLTADNTLAYGYNTINRLTTSTAGSSFTYGYDAGDNLTSISIAGSTTTSLAYDAAQQLQSYTKMNGTTLVRKLLYTYEQDGNRLNKTDQTNAVTTYGWDQANRLTSYAAGTTSATYSYNGDGLRMSKTTSGGAEPFVWNVAEGLPVVVKDGSTSYVTGPGGLPLEQISGNTVYYYHQDELGSTRAITDSTGNASATYNFDAYGNVTSPTGTLTNPFQFAGQYSDPESGLYYLRARYYDPATGQFISRDPLLSMTQGPYGYVHDNPVNDTDPTGLFGLDDLKHLAGRLAQTDATIVNVMHEIAVGALQVSAAVAYLPYYGAYNSMKVGNAIGDKFGLFGTVVSRIVTAPSLISEAVGLFADAYMDWVKNKMLGNGEPICDEGRTAPKLGNWAKTHGIDAGETYFPGIHSDRSIDWEW